MRVKPKKLANVSAGPNVSLKKRDDSPGMGDRGAAAAGGGSVASGAAPSKGVQHQPVSGDKPDLRHVPTLEHVPPDLPKRSPLPFILIGCVFFLLILIVY